MPKSPLVSCRRQELNLVVDFRSKFAVLRKLRGGGRTGQLVKACRKLKPANIDNAT